MAGVGSGGGTKTQCREPRKALFQSPDQEDTSKAPGNGAYFGTAEGSPIKIGQVHISLPDLSLNNNPDNDFLAEALEALLNRIQVDIEVDSNLKGLKKEIHEQTLTKLRQQLTQISQDEWMYKPIDQIIGF
ncbi:unnamed protein product [Porites lobata]|uniref:Anaphase-promoting complex subunit 16 n=1 Tax=Porites lobata TaxID=104759 RepID=A0ABN8R9B7_9CNID|nr:unnamed protein product [Porites lobata]